MVHMGDSKARDHEMSSHVHVGPFITNQFKGTLLFKQISIVSLCLVILVLTVEVEVESDSNCCSIYFCGTYCCPGSKLPDGIIAVMEFESKGVREPQWGCGSRDIQVL